MSTYSQFCPVALGAEVIAERWTPLIIRELLWGNNRFSGIHRNIPRISRNLLTQRLNSLQTAGIIERREAATGRGHEYHLTEAGHELRKVIVALGTWGYRWFSHDISQEHLDPDYLMVAIQRHVRVDNLPPERVVVGFQFRRLPKNHYWLVMNRPDVDLCLTNPGYDVDVDVVADLETLTRVYLGQVDFIRAMKSGDVEVSGVPRHRRALGNWLGTSHFAQLAQA